MAMRKNQANMRGFLKPRKIPKLRLKKN